MSILLARKLGMTQIPDEKGNLVPVTVIDGGECYILDTRTIEKDGYNAVRLCFGKKSAKKINKPLLGVFKKVFGEREFFPAQFIKEFRVDKLDGLEPGKKIAIEQSFKIGEYVDITGYSKGRGFTGVVKRWNFRGGPKSHGSMFIRRPGSIGQTTDPGRVWPGKKMAGRYGAERITIHNLKIVKIYPEKSIILLLGSVPGPKNSILMLRKPRRKKL